MVFCMLGKEIPYPKNDTLFIHKDVYETGFDYELSILGYYNNYPDTYKVINRLMNYTNQSYNNLLSNYKFYCPKLSSGTYMIKKIGVLDLNTKIDVCGTEYEMYGSNPCIFKINTFTENETSTYKYMVNIRFVNYKINGNGNYNFTVNDGKIVTVNKIYELDDIKQLYSPFWILRLFDLAEPVSNFYFRVNIFPRKIYTYSLKHALAYANSQRHFLRLL